MYWALLSVYKTNLCLQGRQRKAKATGWWQVLWIICSKAPFACEGPSWRFWSPQYSVAEFCNRMVGSILFQEGGRGALLERATPAEAGMQGRSEPHEWSWECLMNCKRRVTRAEPRVWDQMRLSPGKMSLKHSSQFPGNVITNLMWAWPYPPRSIKLFTMSLGQQNLLLHIYGCLSMDCHDQSTFCWEWDASSSRKSEFRSHSVEGRASTRWPTLTGKALSWALPSLAFVLYLYLNTF